MAGTEADCEVNVIIIVQYIYLLPNINLKNCIVL